MDFEKRLGRLEQIVGKMEKGDLSLEDSLKMFEEGVKLSRECHMQLNEAEQKVKLLVQVNEKGEAETTDFDVEDEQ